MREFKFRAWHPDDKVIVYDLNTPKLYHGILQSYPEKEKDDYIFMQYIGLKDENGKEIYEGDILRIFSESDGHLFVEEIGEVIYQDGSFIVGEFCPGEFYSEDLEILGNIYENPELMEKKE